MPVAFSSVLPPQRTASARSPRLRNVRSGNPGSRTLRRLGQVRNHGNGKAGVPRERLFEAERSRHALHITPMELLQPAAATCPIGRRRARSHARGENRGTRVTKSAPFPAGAVSPPKFLRQSAAQSRVAKSRSCSTSPRSIGGVRASKSSAERRRRTMTPRRCYRARGRGKNSAGRLTVSNGCIHCRYAAAGAPGSGRIVER